MNQLNKSDDRFRTVDVLPALVVLPSMQPYVAPAAILTQVRENDSYENLLHFFDALRIQPQPSKITMADDNAKKLYFHRSMAFVISSLLSVCYISEFKH
ncbi:MAG: hypothetical protein EZS28_019619 [Streblomastix strix]|uniref:Uncharacterized protein n=1 Tax=Streblomastix strix TaxID=222440 RepID=A0A5J4VRG9_9EUKA|nr:MAG: hypothetical protein EZS28_019619 [Streblomastix strix]